MIKKIASGIPTPLGAKTFDHGTNFALFSSSAKKITLCLFLKNSDTPFMRLPLKNKTGNIWHLFVHDLPLDTFYAYQVDDSSQFLLDPYAKNAVLKNGFLISAVFSDPSFDWKGAKKPNIAMKDLIIYEMHTRGFTIDESSNVQNRGTFLGIIEKIPYLLELGINAVELMPVHIFDTHEYKKLNPINNKELCNYWGYSTLNFFSLNPNYAVHFPLVEFKTLVRELHLNGIEIILDIAFNHTGEGNGKGSTLSFKGLDKKTYYLLNKEGNYLNFSGCGNTFNCNHPVSMALILEALCYLVTEADVDGFRFDLASIFNLDQLGNPLKNSSLVEYISKEPLLADIKLIAEPWDAAGFYQVGSFHPDETRWSEWNGRYRDAARYFLNGLKKDPGKFATRISGSEDLYFKRAPFSSINFITSHDGFSLHDLVSYDQKHNLNNAENNEDGEKHNLSRNFGTEGETNDKKILALRKKQMKNFHLALMVSQGVPLILMGDEYGHTKQGNNNTWCQDNQLNWFLWDALEKNQEFYRFYKKMIALRKNYNCFRKGTFLKEEDISWHGQKPFLPNFFPSHSFVAFNLNDAATGTIFYIAFNAENKEIAVELPQLPASHGWHFLVDTARNAPEDFIDEELQTPLNSNQIVISPYSSVILMAYAI
ncbi:MAG TPA: isoamylase [Parachlamydiaceae bacterium]|nr:isoamylase [Parachlamydiaceae bacterium]